MNIFEVFKASIRKDLKISSSYKFNLIGEIIFNFLLVIFLFFVSYTFIDSDSKYLSKYENNFFLFLLTGAMVIFFISRVFSTMVSIISSAQSYGYLEALMCSKMSLQMIIITSSLYPIIIGLLRVFLIYVFAAIFDPAIFSIINLLKIFFILFLIYLPTAGIAFIVISANLIYKKASFLGSIFLISCMVCSGIFYPIEVLPELLQTVSNILPTTHAVELIRGIFASNNLVDNSLQNSLIILMQSIIYLTIGAFCIDKALIYVKKRGTTAHF